MAKHLRLTDEEFAALKGRVGSGKPVENSPKMACRTDVPGPSSAPPSFTFTLSGQIRGGKNNMKVGRNGKHYPDKTFAKWRDDAVNDIYQHSIVFHKPTELCIEIYYAAGDLRRRDMPGMMDALFHVLERAQVVEDDAQIKEGHWYQLPLDRANPGVRVVLREVGR